MKMTVEALFVCLFKNLENHREKDTTKAEAQKNEQKKRNKLKAFMRFHSYFELRRGK